MTVMRSGCGRRRILMAAAVFLAGCSSGGSGADGALPSVTQDIGGSTAQTPVTDATETTAVPPPIEDPTAPPGLYVSPQGDDANAGTSPSDAFRTINHAAQQLSPGVTLYVLDGVYEEDAGDGNGIAISVSGTEDAWVTITAYPGARPVIRTVHSNGLQVQGASYVEVSHLTFEGAVEPGNPNYSGSGINVDGRYVVQAKNHHIRIIGNTISGFGGGGIPVTGTSHLEIRDNVIFDVAAVEPTQHSGISILEPTNPGIGDDANGYSNYITGNVVYEVENKVRSEAGRFTDGNCIIMDRLRVNDYQGRTLIANNVCYDNGGRGVQVYQSSKVDVVHNTLYQNLKTPEIASRGGDLGAFESSDVVFANNLVFANEGLFPARSADSSGIVFENNLYVGSRPANYGGAEHDGEIVITDVDRELVVSAGSASDARAYDLVKGSSAIDAGSTRFVNVVDRDFAGRDRSRGSAPDIGAFEYPLD